MVSTGISNFFKVCKSYLNLSRESNDNRSLGELFLYFSDEMSDITWIQAVQMLLQMFRTMLIDNTELSDDKIDELVDTFMNNIACFAENAASSSITARF